MATTTMGIWDPMWQITNIKKKEKKGMANRFVQNFKKVNCRKGVGNVQSCYGNFTLNWRNLSSFSWKYATNQSLGGSLTWELEVSQGVLATKEHVVLPKQTCIPAHQKPGWILQAGTTPPQPLLLTSERRFLTISYATPLFAVLSDCQVVWNASRDT